MEMFGIDNNEVEVEDVEEVEQEEEQEADVMEEQVAMTPKKSMYGGSDKT